MPGRRAESAIESDALARPMARTAAGPTLARARRRRVRLAAAGRRDRGQQRGRGRRRRRPHGHRHADGALAVGAVRRGRRTRSTARCGAACSRHAHIDHVGGTKPFPARRRVRHAGHELSLLDQPMPIDAYKAFMPAFADEFDELAELGTRPVTHSSTAPRSSRRASSCSRRRVTPPATSWCSSPTSTSCFAGDLCFFGVTPLAFQGDPADVGRHARRVADLADVIVPGHGPSGARPRCASSRRTCATASHGDDRRRPARGTRGPSASERDPINIERAALLREGRDEIPPSMLKAIGFD